MVEMGKLTYPAIISEYDDDGHYFVVTSPNIQGMVTQGDTLSDAEYRAKDALATMLEGETEFPQVQDPVEWNLKDNQRVIYISIDN